MAAKALEAICDYEWGKGRAEIDYEAGCMEAKHQSVGRKNGREALNSSSFRFRSIPSSCYIVER